MNAAPCTGSDGIRGGIYDLSKIHTVITGA